MAADRATVSVSACLLPDEIKTSIGGTTVYDLNDVANNNLWIYSLTLIAASAEDLIKDGVNFMGQGAAHEGATATLKATDDVVFLFVKHTGTTDGSTASTATLCINLGAGTPNHASVGDIIIEAGECFFARIAAGGTEIQDLNAISSSGTIQTQVFAIVDDGG